MDISWPVFLLFLFILWMVWVRVHEFVRKYPPSCIGLPVLGRIPMIAVQAMRNPRSNFFRELARDGISKGDVWSTFLGMRRVIGLTSYDAVYDALCRQGNEFAWRPRLMDFTKVRMIEDVGDGDQTKVGGIIFSSGDLWREQRRFALSVMRDLGMGKKVTEKKIQLEAKHLIEELCKIDGQAIVPSPILTKTVINVICQFIFGFRTDHDNFEFEIFMKEMKRIINDTNWSVFLPMLFPALFEDTPITRYLGKNVIEAESRMIDFVKEKVAQTEANINLDSDSPPEHFVEAFLRKQRSEGEKSNFTRHQMVLCVYDLFAAGSETTSTFLNWALIYLSVYRDWQTALQAEIDEELGTQSDISYADRLRCHKTMAFTDEIQRHASIAPHSLMHAVANECFFRGYRIPKDAIIIPDIYSVHYDPQVWYEPELFDPTRFLKDSGEYEASKFLIPFSIGKRVCLGESLARMEIFIFLATILRSFDVDIDDEAKALKEEVFVGTDIDIHAPRNHKVILTARNK